MPVSQALAGDPAQTFLVRHLAETQDRMNAALAELGGGSCTITAAADLGLPADVQRLAGGFTSGCLVQWDSPTDIVPVDTSAAVDVSTVLVLDRMPDPPPDLDWFTRVQGAVTDKTSYSWNFGQGNHFIIFGERESDGKPVLVLHSSECEFDYQLNGLLPQPGNWYWRDVQTFRRNDAYLRLLVGPRAVRFRRLSSALVPYSQLRHEIIAELLLDGAAKIEDCFHKPHFFMPTATSVVLGCYLCEPGETVPIFSRHGQRIDLFRCDDGGQNTVQLAPGISRLVVLHGWGRTATGPIRVQISDAELQFNGLRYPVEPGSSISAHKDVVLRDFATGPEGFPSLFAQIREHTPGVIVDTIRQLYSYSVHGFARHREM
jgi:hypothetical protein